MKKRSYFLKKSKEEKALKYIIKKASIQLISFILIFTMFFVNLSTSKAQMSLVENTAFENKTAPIELDVKGAIAEVVGKVTYKSKKITIKNPGECVIFIQINKTDENTTFRQSTNNLMGEQYTEFEVGDALSEGGKVSITCLDYEDSRVKALDYGDMFRSKISYTFDNDKVYIKTENKEYFVKKTKENTVTFDVEEPKAKKELKIKKVLNLPATGVKTPKEDFTFNFTKVSFNKKTEDDEKNQMPNINTLTTSYTESDKTDQDEKIPGKQIIKFTGDALAGVTFPKVGQYVYKVTENKKNITDMTYSKAEYIVSIFTQTDSTGKIVVSDIQIAQSKKDDGTAIENPKKKEYTQGTDDTGDGNNFVFNNNYDKKGGNDNPKKQENPEDVDKQGFTLKKIVDGKNKNSEEKFEFTLKVTKPEGTHSSDTQFSYKIASKDSVSETKTAPYETSFKVSLKHGQRLVFDKVLLGSKVSLTESDSKGYIPSVENSSVLNGQIVNLDDTKANENSKIIFKDKVIGEDGSNFVLVKNTQQIAVGIILNNLPFIILVAFAGCGILFFVKNKKREVKRKY